MDELRSPVLKKGISFLRSTPSSFAPAMTSVPIFEPIGKVAPAAAIAIVPEPSEDIVAPPKSIVEAARYAVLHLFDDETKSYVSFVAGIR